MKFILSSVFSLLTIFSFGQKTAYYQQHVKYKMNIDVDAKNFTYHGNQEITYTNNSSDDLDVLYFHLYWNAFKPGSMMDQRTESQGKNGDKRLIQKVDGKFVSRLSSIPKNEEGNQKVNWIKQNGKTVKFEYQETILKVYLDKPIKAHSTETLNMDWDAVIPKQIRRSGRNNREGIDMTMTQWHPKIAEYDYDGWSAFDYLGREFHAPFADFDVSINIDKDYVIGAGGTLQNPDEVKGYTENPKIKSNKKNKASWKWSANNILDFAWAADKDYIVEEFKTDLGTQIFYVYQKSEKTKYWEESKSYVNKFFQIMHDRFGEYKYPSYSYVQGGDGGMEYGMCSIILGEATSLERLVGLMVHEGGHSWFQQMIATNESTKDWMDEGFTTYAQDLAMDELFNTSKIKTRNPFHNTIKSYINYTKTGKEQPSVWLADHYDYGNSYSIATYIKGALFLIQLEYIMGQENLSNVLKTYYKEWVMKHPTDRDFLHIAQKISGMDLKWFQHYWINTTKTIDYSIKNIEHKKNVTFITLSNEGEIPMPIDFSILTKDNKIINYHIPSNITRTPKTKDAYGDFKILPYWNWTQKEYTFAIPFKKENITGVVIDLSQRMADVNPENNFVEIK